MSLIKAIDLYQQAGNCYTCFAHFEGVTKPTTGCRLPQPRWIGPQYWGSPDRIIVCYINPGVGNTIETKHEDVLKSFLSDKNKFPIVNAYYKANIPMWAGGLMHRILTHHMGLNLDNIALMNIALCSMVFKGEVFPPTFALEECFETWTLQIMKELEPKKVVLCGSSIHRFQSRIEEHTGAKVILGPHYAARLRLKELQDTYSKIRENLRQPTEA